MKERVCRDGDENVYQPRIHSDRIKELYTIGQETGLPLTVLVDYALRSYVNAYQEEKRRREALANEVSWKMENDYEENLREHEFDDIDPFEDGTMYGY